MNLALTIGWLGSATVVGTYIYSARTERIRPFHAANVIAAVLLGTSTVAAGGWPAFALSTALGVVGLVGFTRTASHRSNGAV